MRRFVLAALFFTSSFLQAVPPLNPDIDMALKPCHTRPISKAQLQAAGGNYRKALITNASGVKNIAVIVVRFPSAGGSTSGSPTIASLANVDTAFTRFAQYYDEVSHNTNGFDLNITFFGENTVAAGGDATAAAAGSYAMPQAMEYYGCGDVDSGCTGVTPVALPGKGGAYLIRDALSAARAGREVTLTSTNFHAVLVMHAGYGNESAISATNGDIWSAVYQEPAIISSAGGSFNDGAVFPELEHNLSSPMGVIAHEFGHILSLPDLYNTLSLGGSSVVGNWDLMDSGTYLGSGNNPAHMGAWCKRALGWVTPQVANSRANYSIGYTATTPTAVIEIPLPNGLAQEYFLLEYRSRTSGATFDTQIPGSGLLIWHVDDNITASRAITVSNNSANTVNSGNPHYGVSVVTADGITISNANKGNATNVFSNGGVFTSPKSNNFSRDPSGVNVVSISGVGSASANFDVVNLAVTNSQNISKAITYPNPAGKGYAHPLGEGNATVTFHLTRPTSEYSINIYTLSGDLVRKIGTGQIPLNITRSDDRKWVYEFQWDLKNDSGQHVAPGVYLILVRADGEKKNVKAVVIR